MATQETLENLTMYCLYENFNFSNFLMKCF